MGGQCVPMMITWLFMTGAVDVNAARKGAWRGVREGLIQRSRVPPRIPLCPPSADVAADAVAAPFGACPKLHWAVRISRAKPMTPGQGNRLDGNRPNPRTLVSPVPPFRSGECFGGTGAREEVVGALGFDYKNHWLVG